MEKQKRWQLFVIIAVCILTLYNILPTIIFYSKPLGQPVDQTYAIKVANDITARVNSLEKSSVDWIHSFCKLLHVSPTSVELKSDDPSIITVQFASEKDATLFSRLLPQAGNLIPFVPAQLSLLDQSLENNRAVCLRHVPVHLDAGNEKLFRFATKEESGNLSDFYFELVGDRFSLVAATLGGTSPQAAEAAAAIQGEGDEALLVLAKKILRVTQNFGDSSAIATRFFTSFVQTERPDSSDAIARLATKMEDVKKKLERKRLAIAEEKKVREEQNQLIDASKLELYDTLQDQIVTLDAAATILEAKKELFQKPVKPFTKKLIQEWLTKERQKNPSASSIYTLVLGQRNPFIRELVLDCGGDTIFMRLHPDVLAIMQTAVTTEKQKFERDEINQLVINEVARVSQSTDESITQGQTDFTIQLSRMQDMQSLLAMNLREVGNMIAEKTMLEIKNEWHPSHIDLVREKLPIFDLQEYSAASSDQKRLCLVVIAPTAAQSELPGLRSGSVYVLMRGVQNIIDQYHRFPESSEAIQFGNEMKLLVNALQKRGFIGYSGSNYGLDTEFAKDFIFELDDYYSTLLKATRENFFVAGSKDYATLEFSNVEQRILTQNRIDDAIQEDLLRWKEAYQAAQVSLEPIDRFTVPQPTQNAYIANLERGARAYLRGDDSKIIRWGLDLSGGKSVKISLYDHSNRLITDTQDLHQAVNELYTRINKLGVSERTIRIEDASILIDFPGAQGLSASELVKAAAMYFHIVNEQFSRSNTSLAGDVQAFLQDVWNEAVVTNKKEIQDINLIAWNKLQAAANRSGGASLGIKSSAQTLYQAGLRLVDPRDNEVTVAFDDSLSTIAKFGGSDIAHWDFQSNPLVIVFANYALEGSSLENVQTGYDPAKGNTLHFEVKSSYPAASLHVGSNPRDDFYSWTSQFSEESIVGTPKEEMTKGRGWRMAVILNDDIISAPSLNASLRDQAMITGNFTQREVSKLATDLKAGSLSFTPRILSEQNVSPELGLQERTSGVLAAIIAVLLVVGAMIGYYRFAGVVASVAVLFNILVIWAVMQNIGMTLTLPGIAGVILTVAMAVDANVLVFERVREEFALSGRIASAIQIGYRKAFSAIFDSNITTIIVALILLQFDSGPIKGFAVTLLIGIIASMFTSLFMTRYYFAGWVLKAQNKELKMSRWIVNPSFNFLKWTKTAFVVSAVLLAVGLVAIASQGKSLLGMDFTGGYSLIVDLKESGLKDYRQVATDALVKAGVLSNEVQIRELGRPNLLRIQLAVTLENEGRPFYNLPLEITPSGEKEKSVATMDFKRNPRITWLVDQLAQGGLEIKESELPVLASNWTSMSGQFSESMRNNAVAGLLLALLAILVYITFRFEWKFSVSAVLALVHDLVLTVSVIAIMHKFGAPVQLDLEVIGALMTIIGYSLNDTIIVFDRIREDMRLMKKKSFAEIVNHALNVTLSRTLMTSGTTLLALIALVAFGGHSIFGFSFVMTVGVFLGTFSSLFIATPILVYLETGSYQNTKLASGRI
ncbi:MAG: protein translocase subunit SecD [Verrucomicrobia bacterium]|nr:protein translocase subunit SecD [Verrucomicrobiota bacterium]